MTKQLRVGVTSVRLLVGFARSTVSIVGKRLT